MHVASFNTSISTWRTTSTISHDRRQTHRYNSQTVLVRIWLASRLTHLAYHPHQKQQLLQRGCSLQGAAAVVMAGGLPSWEQRSKGWAVGGQEQRQGLLNLLEPCWMWFGRTWPAWYEEVSGHTQHMLTTLKGVCVVCKSKRFLMLCCKVWSAEPRGVLMNQVRLGRTWRCAAHLPRPA